MIYEFDFSDLAKKKLILGTLSGFEVKSSEKGARL